eukprot:s1830_g7.t1
MQTSISQQEHLRGVGSHTTSFDQLIKGNGSWQDLRLWRGRSFDRRLCERHFRVTCGVIEASPEVWTNPWSHVLISILMPNSWVPFHQGHTNGQLTYHLPVVLPEDGAAELALVERGGALAEHETRTLTHPEETTVTWKLGRTLVFDDSFSHAVRYKGPADADAAHHPPRMLLLTRAWHPELDRAERMALRDFIRRGGEEEPEGYDMLPLPRAETVAMPDAKKGDLRSVGLKGGTRHLESRAACHDEICNACGVPLLRRSFATSFASGPCQAVGACCPVHQSRTWSARPIEHCVVNVHTAVKRHLDVDGPGSCYSSHHQRVQCPATCDYGLRLQQHYLP